jgi:MFS family permease
MPAETVRAEGNEWLLRTAFLVSSVGDWIHRLAVPLLVLELTGSAFSTALAYILEFLPFVLVGLFAGVVADRGDRRAVLIRCDAVSLVLAAALAGLTSMPSPPLAGVYALGLALACVRPFHFPAFHGLVRDTVRDDRLARTNGWVQAVDGTLGMIGPAAGVSVILALGVPTAVLVNAASFGLSVALLVRISSSRKTPVEPTDHPLGLARGILRDFGDGVVALWRTTVVRWGTALLTALILAMFLIQGNLVYLLVGEQVGGSTTALAAVLSAQGAGAVLGSLLAPRLLERMPAGRLLSRAMWIAAAAMLLPALWPRWPVVAASWALIGVIDSTIIVVWFTLRQQIVPSHVLGRVASVSRALSFAAIPVGALLGAWLLEIASSSVLFVAAGLLQCLVAVVTRHSPLASADGRTRVDQEGTAATAPDGG